MPDDDPTAPGANDGPAGADHRDELPEDLNAAGFVGPYTFPNNSRRRTAGVLHIIVAGACLGLWFGYGDGGVLVNDGFLWVGLGLLAVGIYHLVAGLPLKVRETDALAAAGGAVGFAVGHASAQLAWRGLLSRPTWRILLYSAEEPPLRRGLVLVDGVDGEVIAHFVESNPEDWTKLDA